MKKIAVIEGASVLGQKLAQNLLTSDNYVLCVDDLTVNPSPATGTLLKRGVLEVGPLELAFKNEQIQQIYFLPKTFDPSEAEIVKTEFQVNSLIGILKIAEKLQIETVKVVTTSDLTSEALQHYQSLSSKVKLKSQTQIELISEKSFL